MPSLNLVRDDESGREREGYAGEKYGQEQEKQVERHRAGDKDGKRRGRKGVELALDDTHPTILSPILSQLSAIPMPSMSLRDYLLSPTRQASPSPDVGQSNTAIADRQEKAHWQVADLGDGQGRRPLLLVTSPGHALQVSALPQGVMPTDPHVRESFPPPEEVISIPEIQYTSETGRLSLSGIAQPKRRGNGKETVVCAKLLPVANPPDSAGPRAILIVSMPPSRSGLASLSAVILELRSGLATKRLELGTGHTAAVAVSPRAIVICTSHPSPSLHVLDLQSLATLQPSIDHLPCGPHKSLPVFALAGRLLAYTTSTPPLHPGADGLGSIVTSHSAHLRSPRRNAPPGHGDTKQRDMRQEEGGQGALLSSAVEIGGGVARGVWAGIKMGAKVAGRAGAGASAGYGRLAKSAPAGGSVLDNNHVDAPGSPQEPLEVESKSLGESSTLEEDVRARDPSSLSASSSTTGETGGEWIKIIDLFPRRRTPSTSTGTGGRRASLTATTSLTGTPPIPDVVAHFRLPSAKPPPSPAASAPTRSRIGSNPTNSPVSCLSFSPDGTRLLASPSDGRSLHVLEVHPAGLKPLNGGISSGKTGNRDSNNHVRGEVWHQYELRRGNTSADVSDIQWSEDGRWVGVSTGRGTVHIFALSPFGGPATASSHLFPRLTTPTQRHPLSTVITPCARLRSSHPRSPDPIASSPSSNPYEACSTGAAFAFLNFRLDPLKRATTAACLDLAILRLPLNQLELARITLFPASSSFSSTPTPTSNGVKEHGRTGRPSPVRGFAAPSTTSTSPRGVSALTEMMRGMGRVQPELGMRSSIIARWALPLGGDGPGDVLRATLDPRRVTPAQVGRYLAYAEIQTFSHHPSILPGSIYLSHQFEFFSAQPIDEYSPLSILDIEARSKRLVFRPEVRARTVTSTSSSSSSSTPGKSNSQRHRSSTDTSNANSNSIYDLGSRSQFGSKSFDEPLLSALTSVIESPPIHQVPGLPNGPTRTRISGNLPSWRSAMIPISTTAGLLGEGVGRVKREYVKAQAVRSIRRDRDAAHGRNEAGTGAGTGTGGTPLSFEEGTVFAQVMGGSGIGSGGDEQDEQGEVRSGALSILSGRGSALSGGSVGVGSGGGSYSGSGRISQLRLGLDGTTSAFEYGESGGSGSAPGSSSSPSSGIPASSLDTNASGLLGAIGVNNDRLRCQRQDGMGEQAAEEEEEAAEEEEEEWENGWEQEYQLAVEDDGGPDDLVLGLMDEEREERRRWEVMKKERMKMQWDGRG